MKHETQNMKHNMKNRIQQHTREVDTNYNWKMLNFCGDLKMGDKWKDEFQDEVMSIDSYDDCNLGRFFHITVFKM